MHRLELNFGPESIDTFGETVQFSLTRRTNLVGDYRYQITDYDTAPNDSTTHYLLAGIDHHLTEHLIVHAQRRSIIAVSEERWRFDQPILRRFA